MWNMCAITLQQLPRTNNAVEGWHNAINQFIGCKHPSIWTFIEKIKKEQGIQELKMVQMMNNNGALRKKNIRITIATYIIYMIVKTYIDDPLSYELDEYLRTLASNLNY